MKCRYFSKDNDVRSKDLVNEYRKVPRVAGKSWFLRLHRSRYIIFIPFLSIRWAREENNSLSFSPTFSLSLSFFLLVFWRKMGWSIGCARVLTAPIKIDDVYRRCKANERQEKQAVSLSFFQHTTLNTHTHTSIFFFFFFSNEYVHFIVLIKNTIKFNVNIHI